MNLITNLAKVLFLVLIADTHMNLCNPKPSSNKNFNSQGVSSDFVFVIVIPFAKHKICIKFNIMGLLEPRNSNRLISFWPLPVPPSTVLQAALYCHNFFCHSVLFYAIFLFFDPIFAKNSHFVGVATIHFFWDSSILEIHCKSIISKICNVFRRLCLKKNNN